MGYPGVMSSPVLNFNQKDIWVMFSCGSINRLSSFAEHVVVDTIQGLNQEGFQHSGIFVILVLDRWTYQIGVQQNKPPSLGKIDGEGESVRASDVVFSCDLPLYPVPNLANPSSMYMSFLPGP